MPQIEQTEFFLSQLFWLIVLFIGLFMILTYYTIPKIRSFLNRRESFINGHLSKQQELIKKAELLIKEYEEKITEAKKEASTIIEGAKKKSLKESEKILQDTENRIIEKIKSAEIKINASLFISKITNENVKIN